MIFGEIETDLSTKKSLVHLEEGVEDVSFPSSSRPPSSEELKIKVVCAWCPPTESKTSGSKLVSHTICKKCSQKILEELM